MCVCVCAGSFQEGGGWGWRWLALSLLGEFHSSVYFQINVFSQLWWSVYKYMCVCVTMFSSPHDWQLSNRSLISFCLFSPDRTCCCWTVSDGLWAQRQHTLVLAVGLLWYCCSTFFLCVFQSRPTCWMSEPFYGWRTTCRSVTWLTLMLAFLVENNDNS